MKKTPLIFFLILAFLTVVLALVIYYQNKTTDIYLTTVDNNDHDNLSQVNQEELKTNYQTKLEAAFDKFLDQKKLQETANESNQALQQLEQDVLNLIVPAVYKDLHLDLVIAINKIQSQDPIEVQNGLELINQQIEKYPWLSPWLTLFIVNF